MVNLKEEIDDVQEEINEVEDQIRETLPEFFDLEVKVANVQVNPGNGTASANVEVVPEARETVEKEFEGASVTFGRNSRFQFQFNINE